MTPNRKAYRKALAGLIERYRFDKRMEALSEDLLRAMVDSFEEMFEKLNIPIEAIPEVYVEGFANHPDHYMTLDDWLKAWRRIQERLRVEEARTAFNEKGEKCPFCKGTGMSVRYDAKTDTEFAVECPVHCKVETGMVKR